MKVSKEFKEFFNEFHEKFPSGNFLHIATSDGNWETKHIVWCLMHWLDYADDGEKEWLKEHEREIINMCSEMLEMTERQRFKIWDAVEEKRSDTN